MPSDASMERHRRHISQGHGFRCARAALLLEKVGHDFLLRAGLPRVLPTDIR